jgi:DNA mismatch repair ATPase MutS
MRTATEDGACLAASICIKIFNTKAFCFCTTHQNYLTRMAESFLNVTK